MRARNSDSPFWLLLPPPDQRQTAGLRRSNLIVLAILAFTILGMVIVSFVAENGHASDKSKASPKTSTSLVE